MPWDCSNTVIPTALGVWGTFSLRVSLVAQMIKNLPAVQEIQIHSLAWEDHSLPYSCLENSMDRGVYLSKLQEIVKDSIAWHAAVLEVTKSQKQLSN